MKMALLNSKACSEPEREPSGMGGMVLISSMWICLIVGLGLVNVLSNCRVPIWV